MDLKARIEAVLFVTGKAVQLKEIAEILEADEMEVEDEMLSLIMDYASRDGALEIDDENGYILQVKPHNITTSMVYLPKHFVLQITHILE